MKSQRVNTCSKSLAKGLAGVLAAGFPSTCWVSVKGICLGSEPPGCPVHVCVCVVGVEGRVLSLLRPRAHTGRRAVIPWAMRDC